MKKSVLIFGAALMLSLTAGCSKENVQQSAAEVTDAVNDELSLDDVSVDVGEYKNLQVQVEKIAELTDADIEAQIESMIAAMPAETIVKNRAISEGDLVSISYQMYDGTSPIGEAETGYYVTIGSGVFYDGAEKQLVGKYGDDVVDMQVTLSESYPDTALAGKTMTLRVTVEGIIEEQQGMLTDEYVAEISDCRTVEEYKEELKTQMQQSVDYQKDMAKRAAVWEKLLAQTTIENLPEAYVAERIAEYKSYDEEVAASESFSMEDYVSMFYDMTIEEYEAQIEALVMDEIETELIVLKIAQMEGFSKETLTDADIEAYAADMGYEDVETFKAEMDEAEVLQSILLEKVTKVVMDSAVVTEIE